MASVPAVELQKLVQRHDAVVWMDDLAAEPVSSGEFQHDGHAVMDVVEDGEGGLDWKRAIWELRPGVFIVRLDGGLVFGQAQPKANEGVHVGVGDVVDELTDGPAAIAIGGVEFVLAEGNKGCSYVLWQVANFGDGGLAF